MDPRTHRLSENFVLSDFLGNHSVYSQGLANPFVADRASIKKLENAVALCEDALEVILENFGPVSIGYGYISPEVSRAIVKYQDPDKPSHHRFDLGAACDFIAHRWVAGDFPTIMDLYAPGSALGSPITLAHGIDYLDIPYSRLITYSESPYICLAVSARELVSNKPRKAFYENRYNGVPKAKPSYFQYMSPQAKSRAFELLQEHGLPVPWEGAGHPTYHGGGRRQYHHIRVSQYTMVSDWLFDLQSISNGAKNVPSMNLDSVQDAFAAAGIVYDWLLEDWKVPRLPIVEGYVSHLNPYFDSMNDWRGQVITFCVMPPERFVFCGDDPDGVRMQPKGEFIEVNVDVDVVLNSPYYP